MYSLSHRNFTTLYASEYCSLVDSLPDLGSGVSAGTLSPGVSEISGLSVISGLFVSLPCILLSGYFETSVDGAVLACVSLFALSALF